MTELPEVRGRLTPNRDLSELTWLRVGGAADWLFQPADVDDLCDRAAAKPDGCLVALDRITDSRNVGAVLRTCAGAGVDGVLLAADGTAGLTPAAVLRLKGPN